MTTLRLQLLPLGSWNDSLWPFSPIEGPSHISPAPGTSDSVWSGQPDQAGHTLALLHFGGGKVPRESHPPISNPKSTLGMGSSYLAFTASMVKASHVSSLD